MSRRMPEVLGKEWHAVIRPENGSMRPLRCQRPLAVMLGNTKIATPQYGITDADVIYEAAVEGQETRLMGYFPGLCEPGKK